MMRAVPAAALLASPGLVFAALFLLGRDQAQPPSRLDPVDDPGVVEVPTAAPAPRASTPSTPESRAQRVARMLREHPGRAVVACPLEGRLRFAVMPLHVHLDTPGDPSPADFAVVEDTILVAVPPGTGAVNLGTGDGAGHGRFGWAAVSAGAEGTCSSLRWVQGPLAVPGLVRGKVPAGAVVRACGERGATTPVAASGSFTLSLERSSEVCTVRVEVGGRAGRWQEVRADRLDGTVWLDLPG